MLDNTLREGEQMPGVWFSFEEKCALFDALQDAGVDAIDVGIPATSEEDRRFCAECMRRAGSIEPGVSIRARRDEILLAKELGFRAIYLMFPFSEIHIEHKFATTVGAIRDRCSDLVAYARSLGLRVHLVAEDASRGSVSLVCSLAAHAAQSGIEELLLCDTVGATLPVKFQALVGEVGRAVAGRCRLGVHCHNDLGLATANTLAGIEAGATTASTTVNGMGERAGNASLHEVATALPLLLDVRHGVDLKQLPRLCAMAEQFSGVFCSPLTPVVGRNAFRHESGIHVDGLLKEARVYEELQPESVGRTRELVLGKSTGTHYLRALLRQRGIEAQDNDIEALQGRLRQEILARDKSDTLPIHQVLEAHYQARSGFSMQRFWELVDEVLPT